MLPSALAVIEAATKTCLCNNFFFKKTLQLFSKPNACCWQFFQGKEKNTYGEYGWSNNSAVVRGDYCWSKLQPWCINASVRQSAWSVTKKSITSSTSHARKCLVSFCFWNHGCMHAAKWWRALVGHVLLDLIYLYDAAEECSCGMIASTNVNLVYYQFILVLFGREQLAPLCRSDSVVCVASILPL